MHPRLIAFFVALVLLCTGAVAHVEPLHLSGLPALPADGALEHLACQWAALSGDRACNAQDGAGDGTEAEGSRLLAHAGIDGLGDSPGVMPPASAPWPQAVPRHAWLRGREAIIPLPPYLDGLQRPPC